jgi:hypothetical protein
LVLSLREAVEGDLADAELRTCRDKFQRGGETIVVASMSRQAACLGPATVSIGDDADVTRHVGELVDFHGRLFRLRALAGGERRNAKAAEGANGVPA